MFISFEGSEGVGKTTLVTALTTWLTSIGHDVITTREPGGTPLAEKIRAMVLAEDMCVETELLLMFAARAEHIHRVIQPALAKGQWVLCDRFVDASFAYQGGGRGIDFATIQQLQNSFVSCMPSITFWLDAPVETGLARANARQETDRFEQEKVDFFKKIQAGYGKRQAEDSKRIIRVDATQSAEEVFAHCKQQIESIM